MRSFAMDLASMHKSFSLLVLLASCGNFLEDASVDELTEKLDEVVVEEDWLF